MESGCAWNSNPTRLILPPLSFASTRLKSTPRSISTCKPCVSPASDYLRCEITLFRLRLPAQPVDATPSNAMIRQCFPGRSDLFGCPRSKPSQGSVPADLTLASDLAFVFNASRVRLECCVDPLRPPRLPGTCTRSDTEIRL